VDEGDLGTVVDERPGALIARPLRMMKLATTMTMARAAALAASLRAATIGR
jgi:hypothetical protein